MLKTRICIQTECNFGSVVSSVSWCFLHLEISFELSDQPMVIEQHVCVLPDLTFDVIMGMDWLLQNNPHIAWANNKLCLGCEGCKHPACLQALHHLITLQWATRHHWGIYMPSG